MTHDAAVRLLASLFRAGNQARPILILGAGASFSSGIPLAAECVKRLAKRVYAERVKGGAIPPEYVKLTEWHDWLQKHDWFISSDERLAENFPLVVEHLLVPREYRKRVLLELMHPQVPLGQGYRDLAKLVLRGLVRTIFTTNFDTCLPDALAELRVHLGHIAEVNRSPDDFREFDIYARTQIVWLHGRAEQYSDCNLIDETEHLNAKLVRLLTPLLSASPVVVIGYRGVERSVMHDLFGKNVKSTQHYRNGIYWCLRTGEQIHPRVRELQKSVGANFSLVEIAGFDELMADLGRELREEDCYPLTGVRSKSLSAPAFDDRPVPGASLEELDADLMLAVMRQYCEKLGRKPVTRETLVALLREQGLLALEDGSEVPTAGCILLFGVRPQGRFPHATVAVTIAAKRRVVFEGNLIRQREQLREWLSGDAVNPTLRVKRRATHEDRPAYAERALIELLVNLLVHRDYERPDCAHIDVEPGDSIRFENPGGLPKEVVDRVKIDESGQFEPVPNTTGLRNRSLCDVFFGISQMERAGTGLTDVSTLAREAGGSARFTHDEQRQRFEARISQAPASAGSTTVARDTRPTGVYVLNALPFVSMPDAVSLVRLRTRLSERPPSLSLAGAGTFVLKADFLWSFVPLPILLQTFAPIADPDGSINLPRRVIEENANQRNMLSWLIRKHFERHLERFADRGFFLEADHRRRRAYFHGVGGGPRTLTYDTSHRKAVQRQVVKQRAEGPRAWFENEGIGYEVVQLDDVWAIRIKPFYMFTKSDAGTPLPAFVRGSRATRRIKFDRNKNVEDDLTFWARFLSEGAPTINIGQDHMQDLILSGSFLTVEVPEAEHGQDDD